VYPTYSKHNALYVFAINVCAATVMSVWKLFKPEKLPGPLA